jgi:pimeloyl-ACP methyl ester carboxylesterase
MRKLCLTRFILIGMLLQWTGTAAVAETLPDKASSPMPGHWLTHWLDEPVYKGRIHVVETGTGHEQSIFLIHGLGQNGLKDWLPVIPHLEQHYHVVAFDLPGFGESDSSAAVYSPANYSRLVHWVVTNMAKGPVVVIGHSLGAAISLKYADDYPSQVNKLVLVDAAGILQRTAYLKYLVRLSRPEKEDSLTDKVLNRIRNRVDAVNQHFVEKFDNLSEVTDQLMASNVVRNALFKDRSSLNAALSLMEEDFSEEVRHLSVPTHIIWGEQDEIAPLRTGKVLNTLIPSADLHVLAHIGHNPMMQAPEQFLEILDEVLAHAPSKEPLVISSTPGNALVCRNESYKTYSGSYSNIILSNCNYAKLSGVIAGGLEIKNSRVELENVYITNPGTAVKISNSVVEGTNLVFKGTTGLELDAGRIDFAGALLSGSETAIKVKHKSLLYFSLSETQTPIPANLHGAFVLYDTILPASE